MVKTTNVISMNFLVHIASLAYLMNTGGKVASLEYIW